MMLLSDISFLTWSKWLVALPACLSWIFAALTLGLAFVWVVMETIAHLTGDGVWWRMAQRWRRPMVVGGALSLAGMLLTGGAVAFHWVGLWQRLPWLTDGTLLLAEGVILLLEILWLLLALKGRQGPDADENHHLLFVWLSAMFMGLLLWCPVAVEAWLEVPVGASPDIATGALDVTSVLRVLFSSWAVLKFFHILLTSWLVGAMVLLFVGGRMALARGTEGRQEKYVLWTGVAMGLLCWFGVMCTGDSTGYGVVHNQSAKMAAMQGVEQGGREVPFTLVGQVKIPKMLSRLGTHSNRGYVAGRQDILNGYGQEPSVAQKQAEAQAARVAQLRWRKAVAQGDGERARRYQAQWREQGRYLGYSSLEQPADALPQREGLLFWAFRVMVLLGLSLVVLLGLQFIPLVRPASKHRHAIWRTARWGLPLALTCSLCGWLLAEMGREPWTVTGLLPSWLAVSLWPASWAMAEIAAVAVLCGVLLVWGWKKISAGWADFYKES